MLDGSNRGQNRELVTTGDKETDGITELLEYRAAPSLPQRLEGMARLVRPSSRAQLVRALACNPYFQIHVYPTQILIQSSHSAWLAGSRSKLPRARCRARSFLGVLYCSLLASLFESLVVNPSSLAALHHHHHPIYSRRSADIRLDTAQYPCRTDDPSSLPVTVRSTMR